MSRRYRSRSPSPSAIFRRYRSPSPSATFCRYPCRFRSRSRSRSGRESETLTHRGASTMRVDHPNSESRAAVEREFAELLRRHDKLMEEKNNIRNRAKRLEDKMDHTLGVLHKFERDDALPTAVILFVHLLEKAILYFQFKTSAKKRHNFENCYDPDDVAALLRQDEELMSDFFNIGDLEINNAATALYWEPFSKGTRPHHEPLLSDWIYRLVYRALRADYVMDQDPEVELKKMMKSQPYEYDRYFLVKQLPAECKKMSKEEAYRKYSELVSIIITTNKEALEEKHSTVTGSRNKEALRERRYRSEAVG